MIGEVSKLKTSLKNAYKSILEEKPLQWKTRKEITESLKNLCILALEVNVDGFKEIKQITKELIKDDLLLEKEEIIEKLYKKIADIEDLALLYSLNLEPILRKMSNEELQEIKALVLISLITYLLRKRNKNIKKFKDLVNSTNVPKYLKQSVKKTWYKIIIEGKKPDDEDLINLKVFLASIV